MRGRRHLVAIVAGAVLAAAAAVPLVSHVLRSHAGMSSAADVSQFNAGNIISDQVFFAGQVMDAKEIDAFIAVKGASCVAGSDGTPCLKDFRMDTTSRAADAYCNGYSGATGETAGAIIAQVARSCGISPRVLLVTLQKEQALLTDSGSRLYASRYRIAMGYGCPDTAACDTTYYGFQNQLYSAARQFKLYGANPTHYTYRAGVTKNIYWSPTLSCGSAPVTIANQATADLYNYTPYQPNAASLAAGYGLGDGCSSYGNRNFWLYFTDWFGSTQYDATAATLPKGSLDAASSDGYGRITVAGWAFDPDGPDQTLQVQAYVDGQPVMGTFANLYRGDVASAFPDAGALHGYQMTFPYALGSHQVCAYAINIGAGKVDPQLGCQTVDNTDAGAPVGSLDSVTSPAPNVVAVNGWAVDQDSRSATLAVHVYLDGKPQVALQASDPRPDVGTLMGTDPNHGYSGSIPATRGQHTVCTYAINVGLGVTNTPLGCAQVTVRDPADYNPTSSLDSVTASGGTVSLNGWAFDPDTPGAPIAMHVYVDNAFMTQIGTGGYRPDVGRVYSDAGSSSGYSWQGVLPAGQHTVCVFAINTGFGTVNPVAGCRQVTTVGGGAANPIGSLDGVSGGFGTVSLGGWAYDVDTPSSPDAVHVYIDNAFATALAADAPRPDVAKVLGGSAGQYHGFGWTGQVAPGQHQVCAYAINVGAGAGNTLLGCRTVTVVDPEVAHDPKGSLDAVTVSGTTVTAAGWALDPDLGQAPTQVHVYVDYAFSTAFFATAWRGDVGAVYPDSGPAHGFNWSGTLSSGQHTVCAFAINEGQGTGTNPLLGCRVVTVR